MFISLFTREFISLNAESSGPFFCLHANAVESFPCEFLKSAPFLFQHMPFFMQLYLY